MTIIIIHTRRILLKSITRQRYSSSLLFIIYHCFESSNENNEIRKPNELHVVNRKGQLIIIVDDMSNRNIQRESTIKYVDSEFCETIELNLY